MNGVELRLIVVVNVPVTALKLTAPRDIMKLVAAVFTPASSATTLKLFSEAVHPVMA
jgi:hypothetical protein